MATVAEFFSEINNVCEGDVQFFIDEGESYNQDIHDIRDQTGDINLAIIELYKRAVLEVFPTATLEARDTSTPSFFIIINGNKEGEAQANCIASSISFYETDFDYEFENHF